MSADIETLATIRDMQGSDGKDGHWYILGEKQRAVLTRIIDALTNPDEHAKVLLDEAKDEDSTCSLPCCNLRRSARAGALALGLCCEKDKRIAELEAFARAECELHAQKLAALEAELAAAKADSNALRTSRDEWAEKHCQLNENYDFAIAHHANERAVLRAENDSLRKQLAEAKADLEKLFAYDAVYCAAVLLGNVGDDE